MYLFLFFFSFIILKYENTHKKKKRTDQAIGDWLVKIKLKMSKKNFPIKQLPTKCST